MSDKQNNLNNDDDNIQFDKVTSTDQQKPDKSPINLGTDPLKRLSSRQQRISALPDNSVDSSESVVEDKPSTEKLPEQSGTLEGITDDKLKSKLSDNPEVDKSLDSTPVKDDQSPNSKLSEETPLDTKDSAKQDTDNTPDTSSEIQFESESEVETDKPKTYARRSTLDNLHDRASFLSFKINQDEQPPKKNPDTAVLPDQSPSWKKVIEGQAQGTTGTIGEQREVLFVIRGMIERVVMKDNTTATLGRFDTGTVPNEEIDLIPYGAIDRGVSRRHCKVQLRDNQLHVIDLGSTNGTFLAGVRLKANEPTILRKGDELLLGRLAVQVLFR